MVMAPIRIKHVVSYTSQDDNYPVTNLLATNGAVKGWLCGRNDKTGKLSVELELEKATRIEFIDIGNSGSALVGISVGRSCWPRDKTYATLLPMVCFMSVKESRNGQNKTAVKMFNTSHFAEAQNEEWDRVLIDCLQPYKKDGQFGLSFIQFKTTHEKVNGISNKILSPLSSSPSNSLSRMFLSSPRIKNEDIVKEQLRKIADTAQKGSLHIDSRAAQLVVAASSHPIQGHSSKLVRKQGPLVDPRKNKVDFVEETNEFLSNLNVAELDLSQITATDIRNRLEKERGCTLTAEENQIFIQKLRILFSKSLKKSVKKKEKANKTITKGKKDVSDRRQTSVKNLNRDVTSSSRKGTLKRKSQGALSVAEFSSGDESGPSSSPPNIISWRSAVVTEFIEDYESVEKQCPVCFENFPPAIVERHASHCNGFSLKSQENLPPTIIDSSEGSDEELPQPSTSFLVKCPLCFRYFSQDEICHHAGSCEGDELS